MAFLKCPPPLLPAHGLRALLGRGDLLLLLVMAARWGRALPCLGVSPRSLAARRGRVLMGGAPPPSFPPLTAARVKRVRPFDGSPSLVSSSSHAVHGERGLLGFFPFLRLPPVLPGLFPCDPAANLTLWVSCLGWVNRRLCRLQ